VQLLIQELFVASDEAFRKASFFTPHTISAGGFKPLKLHYSDITVWSSSYYFLLK